MRRRIHRVLVVAGFLAIVGGLWPAPAHASISCRVLIFQHCAPYACCIQICTSCYNSQTGITDIECGDTECWSQYP
jgi:hypothetical protein